MKFQNPKKIFEFLISKTFEATNPFYFILFEKQKNLNDQNEKCNLLQNGKKDEESDFFYDDSTMQ